MSGLAAEVAAALGRRVGALRPVSGGMLNDAHTAVLEDGGRVFVKAHADPLPGTFPAEAAGLAWLAEPGGGPRVPAVLAHTERWLALEWIEAAPLSPAAEEALGRGLAALHAAGASAFGATPAGTPGADGHAVPPMRVGPLLLPNAPAPTWGGFFAEQRLRPLTRMAEARGALPGGTAAAIDSICERIEGLAGPPEPPARLHGDLWAGNVLADARGAAWLIDPAVHGGHRETDLAMLRLFGGPSERCFAAYAEVAPLSPGHDERLGLWQLAPLLVHAVLFGGGYGGRVARAAARYA